MSGIDGPGSNNLLERAEEIATQCANFKEALNALPDGTPKELLKEEAKKIHQQAKQIEQNLSERYASIEQNQTIDEDQKEAGIAIFNARKSLIAAANELATPLGLPEIQPQSSISSAVETVSTQPKLEEVMSHPPAPTPPEDVQVDPSHVAASSEEVDVPEVSSPPTQLDVIQAAKGKEQLVSDRIKPWYLKSKEEIQDLDFSTVPAKTVGRLRAEQISWLQPEQVQQLSAEQVNALSPKTVLSSYSRTRYGPRQLRALAVEHLGPGVVAQIHVTQLQRMNTDQIGKLNASKMTAEQVNGLSPKTTSSLYRRWVNPPELRALKVADLPGETIAAIEPKQIHRMSAQQIKSLGDNNKVQHMTAEQVNALSPMKWRNVKKRWRGKGSTQLHALKVGQLADGVAGQIELKQLRRMKPEQIREFRPEQVAEMSTTQLRGLMPLRMQLPSVKQKMFARVRALDMSKVSAEVIPQLGARFVRHLTVDQIRGMKAEQFSAMYGGTVFSQFGSLGNKISQIDPEEFGKIAGPAIGKFRGWQIQLVTEKQTENMTAEQVNSLARRWTVRNSSVRDLQHVSSIPANQMSGISNRAIRCFRVDQIGDLTTQQIGQMEARQFNYMTRAQLAQVDVNHIAPKEVAQLKINSRRFSGHRVYHRGGRQRFSNAQLTTLLNQKTSELSATQLSSLSKKQWGLMKPESIGRITPEEFGRLSSGWVNNVLAKLSDQQICGLKSDQIEAMQFGSRRGNSLTKIKWLEKAAKVVDKQISNIENQLRNQSIKPENRAKLEAELQRLKGLRQSIDNKLAQKPKTLLGQAADRARGVARSIAKAPTDLKEVVMTRARGVMVKGNDPDKVKDSKGQTLTAALQTLGDIKTQDAFIDALGYSDISRMSKSEQQALMHNLEQMQPLIELNKKQGNDPMHGITEALEEKRKSLGASRLGMSTMEGVIKDQVRAHTEQAFRNNGCSEQDARAATKVALDGNISPAALQDGEKRAECIAKTPALQEVPQEQRHTVAQALAIAGPEQNPSYRNDLIAVAKAAPEPGENAAHLHQRAVAHREQCDELMQPANGGLSSLQAEKAAIVMQSPAEKEARKQEGGPTAVDYAQAIKTNGIGAANDTVAKAAQVSANNRQQEEQAKAKEQAQHNAKKPGMGGRG